MLSFPSQLARRSTYKTPTTKAEPIPGFELVALVSPQPLLLPLLSVAFHEDCPIGVYVLLLDQIASQQDGLGPTPPLVQDGDLALLTLGPTVASGATILLSESVTEGGLWLIVIDGGKAIEAKGMPFDSGLIAAISTTPGRLTQLTNSTSGARFTARRQGC